MLQNVEYFFHPTFTFYIARIYILSITGGKLSTIKREGFTRRYAGKGRNGNIGKENRRIGVKTKENILNSILIRKRGKKGGKDKNGKKRGKRGEKRKKKDKK